MRVLITGGSGFVGTHLSRHCLDLGHHVTALGGRSIYDAIDHPEFEYMSADTTRSGRWQQRAADADLIFNLAGRTIFQRWSRRIKRQIYDSRVQTTHCLVDALPAESRAVLVSTSAVGYYGDCGNRELVESAPPGDDFLASVSVDWESEANKARAKGARVVVARFGIVLGTDGGALAKMVPAFRSFMGGPLGHGRQWFPWIHIQDLIAACWFLASREDLQGAFNICAPHPVRNGQMARTLGHVLGRPSKMAVPEFMLKIMMGELAGVVLGGQRTVPAALTAAGFEFNYPELEAALIDLVGSASTHRSKSND
jgi:hypothetical protein